jgi:hypothetical protein
LAGLTRPRRLAEEEEPTINVITHWQKTIADRTNP